MRAAAALLLLAACATGWTQSVTVGGTFTDERSFVVVALEVTPLVHETFVKPQPPSPGMPMEPDHRGPPRYLGIGATASTGVVWNPTLGATTFGAVGVDYFPFLFESGAVVGFGGQVGYASGKGAFGVAPRLWFTAPVGELAGAPLCVGVMLRGQLGLDGSGAGPSLVITRAGL